MLSRKQNAHNEHTHRPRRLTFEALERRELMATVHYDYGDAPDAGDTIGKGDYETIYTQNPLGRPRHEIKGAKLGKKVDYETLPYLVDGSRSSKAYQFGDNFLIAAGNGELVGQDEDGVRFTSYPVPNLTTASTANLEVTVTAASGPNKLDAWIDFNSDGDFVDDGEQIFKSRDVVDGINKLSYIVPAKIPAGRTYCRFRISAAGNLTPLGTAPDGEIEDYAIVIGARERLNDAMRQLVDSHKLQNNVLSQSMGPGAFDPSNVPLYIVEPYFSAVGLRGFLAAPNSIGVNTTDLVDANFTFWKNHVTRVVGIPNATNATLLRYVAYENGTVYGSPIGADADDSALAEQLSLAEDYRLAGGSQSVLDNHRDFLRNLADTLASLVQTNGLPLPFVDPTNGYKNQQLLDCLEVAEGLEKNASLERFAYGNSSRADMFQAKADQVNAAIRALLYDSTSGLYRQYTDTNGAIAPFEKYLWYPYAFNQSFPIIQGLVSGDTAQAKAMLDSVYNFYNGQYYPSYLKRSDAVFLAWASVKAGNIVKSKAILDSVYQWAWSNSVTDPYVPYTVADYGMLIQALLPQTNPDVASTNANTSVAVNVRQNDYSVQTVSSSLIVTIPKQPENGIATVLADGRILYTPTSGFSGKEIVTYQVRDSIGGTRLGRLTVTVNSAPPAIVQLAALETSGNSHIAVSSNRSSDIAPSKRENHVSKYLTLLRPHEYFIQNTSLTNLVSHSKFETVVDEVFSPFGQKARTTKIKVNSRAIK